MEMDVFEEHTFDEFLEKLDFEDSVEGQRKKREFLLKGRRESIKYLRIDHCNTTRLLKGLFKDVTFENLLVLHLVGCIGLVCDYLPLIGRACLHVSALEIRHCPNIEDFKSDSEIQSSLRKKSERTPFFPELEQLAISYCDSLRRIDLFCVPAVTVLMLYHNECLENVRIPLSMTLTHLHLRGCSMLKLEKLIMRVNRLSTDTVKDFQLWSADIKNFVANSSNLNLSEALPVLRDIQKNLILRGSSNSLELGWKPLSALHLTYISQISWDNLGSLNLAGLQLLSVDDEKSQSFVSVLKNGYWQDVESLDLGVNNLTDDDLTVLCQWQLSKLRSLRLGGSRPNGRLSFLSNARWNSLKVLDLTANQLTPEDIEFLGSITWTKTLEKLTLRNCGLTDSAIQKVCSWHLNHLLFLDLSQNSITDEGAAFLQGNWDKMQSLLLSKNSLTASGLFLLTSKVWPELRTLDLSDNKLGNGGALILSLCECWPRLEFFSIAHNCISEADKQMIKNAKWFSNVIGADLFDWIGPQILE
eukprot:TRINITY_DN5559_c0_g1_i6.p1 TRINITY_DN5559_c0_g1~~TRINITY_DN5559_c0_g1_i6.p1  ORF type:complete len:552 (-),score=107.76 TRINITY_DN5559_c0_g1_i6:1766-3352(-)